MIVVSNTSPIMNLAIVGQLHILERLYEKVFIPEAVFRELSATGPELLSVAEMRTVLWVETRSVYQRLVVDSLLLELGVGEAEAIALAMEMNADLLLIDERRGRRVASRFGLRCIGLLGALIKAKHQGYIGGVKPVLDDMITKAGFWIGRHLYARILTESGE